jgi:hypothetical protein
MGNLGSLNHSIHLPGLFLPHLAVDGKFASSKLSLQFSLSCAQQQSHHQNAGHQGAR